MTAFTLPKYMPITDFLDYVAQRENAVMTKSVLEHRTPSFTIDTSMIRRCGPPITASFKVVPPEPLDIVEEPTPEDIAESKTSGKNYYIPHDALVGVSLGPDEETVLKFVAFLGARQYPWGEGQQLFFVLIEEPIRYATKSTRSMPPSMKSYLGVPADSEVRMKRQRGRVHRKRH